MGRLACGQEADPPVSQRTTLSLHRCLRVPGGLPLRWSSFIHLYNGAYLIEKCNVISHGNQRTPTARSAQCSLPTFSPTAAGRVLHNRIPAYLRDYHVRRYVPKRLLEKSLTRLLPLLKRERSENLLRFYYHEASWALAARRL
ncbi:Protein of unknown function [Gryllus bimaculatus]|nr:Protein of unknown function [Gryllus bimaculatus]